MVLRMAQRAGLFETINRMLVTAGRERFDGKRRPQGVVLDHQNVKATESGGPRGYGGGKKVNGRTR